MMRCARLRIRHGLYPGAEPSRISLLCVAVVSQLLAMLRGRDHVPRGDQQLCSSALDLQSGWEVRLACRPW